MEQRLIDGNELFGIVSLLNSDIVKANPVARWLIQQVLHDIGAMPTIKPDGLQVIKRLQEELATVTAERDAAVSDLNFIEYCGVCKTKCNIIQAIDRKADGKCAFFEWRGARKKEGK